MKWDKLTIVLLSELVSQNDGSTNCQIASYILHNIESVRGCNIEQLSDMCHVSNSSISRFCKEIGLTGFSELREILMEAELDFELYDKHMAIDTQIQEFGKRVGDSIYKVMHSIDREILQKLVRDIYRYENVLLLGLLKAETVAMNLQSDLMILGKHTVNKVSFAQQRQCVSHSTGKDLIIIFSYKGIYLDLTKALKGRASDQIPRIYFVTSDQDASKNRFVYDALCFESKKDYASHPFQLQLVGSLIAQQYGQLIFDNQ